MKNYKTGLFSLILCAYCISIQGQTRGVSKSAGMSKKTTAYKPLRHEVLIRYKQAALMDSIAKNTVFKTSVQANWSEDGNGFWYVNNLKGDKREFFFVDAINARRRAAFSTEKLASGLSEASGKTIKATDFPLKNFTMSRNGKTGTIEMDGQWWQVDLSNYKYTSITAPIKDTTQNENRSGRGRGDGNNFSRGPFIRYASNATSPDKQWTVYIQNHNIFLKGINGDSVALTTDGTNENPYGQLAWSPDSKYAVGYKMKVVTPLPVYYLLTSVPGTTRAQLRQNNYLQPGEEMSSYEMFLLSVTDKKALKVNADKIDYAGTPQLHWRGNDSRYFTYRKTDRGHQRFRIIEVDAQTGDTRNIVDEKTNTFIYHDRIFTSYLPDTNEIIWLSEKDGWKHLYLVDAVAGNIKNQITKGDWVVRNVDSVDEKKREIWFTASGMNAEEDPYFIHYYRISFDGENLVRLTKAKGNHTVNFSPDRRFYLDTYSQVNIAPVTELHRTSDGAKIMDIEKADISSYLATGIKLPEVFVAKGRDGKTEIWGVVCWPSKMDPKKSYPVIENIYAGPQDSFSPKNFMTYGEMQSIAELGFIVVQMDGMGTANRSKAFHDVCWKNLADAGFPDRILWIKALAAKYPTVDAGRVGVYGTSAGGQNSLGALLFHPEFYDAAVSSCGCHDNRVDKQWWNEQWMGYPLGKHYEEQSNIVNAHKLLGDLLLIVGEADTNVPPESTYRVADALIKAGKDFDFLAIPGMGHSDGGPYGRKKKRDFFVKHLLGVDPPNRNTNESAAL